MADRALYSHESDPRPTGFQFLEQYADRLGQLFTAAIWPLGSIGGSADAVTATCDPALTAGLVEHMRFALTWAATNTGGMTLAIDGGSAVPVLKADGSAMTAGDAEAGSRALLEYVGSAFLVIGSSGAGAGAAPYFVQITASTTWTKPDGYHDDAIVILEAWGAGQGGRRESSNSNGGAPGAGGKGGHYRRREMRYADVPSSASVSIGAGGPGATAVGPGTNGGSTTIGSLLTAAGGGITAISGGPLWDGGISGADAMHGGAGGGIGSGTLNPGGTSIFAGNGGSGAGHGTSPTAGDAPGGGGGGSGQGGAGTNSTAAAAGARGEVRIRIVG